MLHAVSKLSSQCVCAHTQRACGRVRVRACARACVCMSVLRGRAYAPARPRTHSPLRNRHTHSQPPAAYPLAPLYNHTFTQASATACASRVGAIYVAANSHASSLYISNTHVSGPLWLGPKRPIVCKRRGLRGDFWEEAEEEPGEVDGQALIGREEHVAQVQAELESLEQVQKELSVIDEEVMKWIASHGSQPDPSGLRDQS